VPLRPLLAKLFNLCIILIVISLSGCKILLTTCKSFLATSVGLNSGIALSFNFCDLISAAFMFGFGFGKGLLASSVGFNSGIALSFNFCDLIFAAFMFGFGFGKGLLASSVGLNSGVAFAFQSGNNITTLGVFGLSGS